MDNQNVNLQSKLLEKMFNFCKLSVKLVFLSLLTVLYLLVPISAAHAINDRDPGYPVCYFGNTWQWGLHTANKDDWQALSGKWVYSNQEKQWEFHTTTPRNEVDQSCRNAKQVYNLSGNVTGLYAAVNRKDSNHDLVFN